MTSFGMICHIFNEELMLPHFITAHTNLFERVIVVDHHSTDYSWDIIEDLAPHWRIVPSRLSCFDAVQTDLECQEYEEQLNTDFKVVLTATEFIFGLDYRETLIRLREENPQVQAFGGCSYILVDKEDTHLPFRHPLVMDHHYGCRVNKATNTRERWRFTHTAKSGNYTPGRHSTNLPCVYSEDLNLLHWRFAPWPQAKERKLQIAARVPQSDLAKGMGAHHIHTEKTLEEEYQKWLAESYDLLTDPKFKSIYEGYIL